MKKSFLTLAVAISSLGASAQSALTLSGTISGNLPSDSLELYIAPLEMGKSMQQIQLEGDQFHAQISGQSNTIYQLSGVRTTPRGRMQCFGTVYLHEGNNELQINLADNVLTSTSDENNAALSGYVSFVSQRALKYWQREELPIDELKSFLRHYPEAADSVLARHSVAPIVADYIRLTAADLVLTGTERRQKQDALPFSATELLEGFAYNTDTPAAFAFPNVVQRLLAAAQGNNLSERIAALKAAHQNPEMSAALSKLLVENFLARFPYKERFDEGLAQLEAATAAHQLDTKYIDEYKQRRSAMAGSDFPKTVLRDVNGKAVDFAQFRGSYVYIDLWASWCAPCVREVPHLQKLEHELKNKNVKFVSISVDTDLAAWKAKMKQLNLTGNQFVVGDRKLMESLGISGIPHFLIYDKNGKLLVHKADRPSSGDKLKNYLESLQ